MQTLNNKKPIIIAHRGASGSLPEHTLESYDLAIKQGADFIEPDLVITKDGVLIARHENEISLTTNISSVFPDRKSTKIIDGRKVTGWFTEDFTIREIKKLKAKERLEFRSSDNNNLFSIPTFKEILILLNKRSKELGKHIGVYPETKNPTYFRNINLPLENQLIEDLKEYNYYDVNLTYIQSFEVSNLLYLNSISEIPLVQLVSSSEKQPYDQNIINSKLNYDIMVTETGLKDISSYADAIGVPKNLIIPFTENRDAMRPTDLIERAHNKNLLVHVYTFRNEARFLLNDYQGKPEKEYLEFYSLGVDGLFTDFTHTAYKVLNIN